MLLYYCILHWADDLLSMLNTDIMSFWMVLDNNSRILVKALTRVLPMSANPRRSRGTTHSAISRCRLYPLYWCWIVHDHTAPWLSILQCMQCIAVCVQWAWAEMSWWAVASWRVSWWAWAAWLHTLHSTAYYYNTLYYCILYYWVTEYCTKLMK